MAKIVGLTFPPKTTTAPEGAKTVDKKSTEKKSTPGKK